MTVSCNNVYSYNKTADQTLQFRWLHIYALIIYKKDYYIQKPQTFFFSANVHEDFGAILKATLTSQNNETLMLN